MAIALRSAIDEIDALIQLIRLERPPDDEASAKGRMLFSAPAKSSAAEASKEEPQSAARDSAGAGREAARPPPNSECAGSELFGLFLKAKVAVGRVAKAEEIPNSAKLYRCTVDVGHGERRQIIAGLRKHIAVNELEGSLVVVILNLKTAKLAGELSQGMILAASGTSASPTTGQTEELVYPLRPQGDARAGDAVYPEGNAPTGVQPKEFKHWKKIQAHLAVRDSLAVLQDRRLITRAGAISVPSTIADGSSIS